MKTITIKAEAKVNLALNVLKQKENGYHEIDTLMAKISLSDLIVVSEREDNEVYVEYTNGRSYDRDAAEEIANAIIKRYSCRGADIIIDKVIPERAGLGGSSADAGAVARAMKRMYNLPDIDKSILSEIGSDVPFMYSTSKAARVTGTGDIVTPVSIKRLYGVLIVPKDGLNTADIYAAYDELGGENGDMEEFLISEAAPFNALERAAFAAMPILSKIKQYLKTLTPFVTMSGSGSSILAYTNHIGASRQMLSEVRAKLGKSSSLKILPVTIF